MSIRAINFVWEKSEHKGSTLLLMLAVADYANDDWCAWPSIDSLARKTRLTPRNVQLLIREATASGELQIHAGQGRHGTNLYEIIRKNLKPEVTGVKSFHPPRNPVTPDFTQSVRTHQHTKEKSELDGQAEAIYAEYPLKVGKPAALAKIKKAIKQIGFESLYSTTRSFAAARSGNTDFCPHPATWFNQQRYLDDPSTWNSNGTYKGRTTESTRNTGTANAGKSAQYAGVGKVS